MNRTKPRQVENIRPTLKKALEEYKPDLLKDSEEYYELKTAIEKLPEVDRIVILLYTELQSYTKLGKILNVSRSTCYWMVKRIRKDLLEGHNSSIP